MEDARGNRLLAAALLEVGEAAHGEVGVREERERERRVAKEGEECGLELPLVEGADGEVGAEEGEQKLEARREREPAREGQRFSRPERRGGGHGGVAGRGGACRPGVLSTASGLGRREREDDWTVVGGDGPMV